MGRLYLPEYKLGSLAEKGYNVMRYNRHHLAKGGMWYADVEVRASEKDITLEPLRNHSQSRAWMKCQGK